MNRCLTCRRAQDAGSVCEFCAERQQLKEELTIDQLNAKMRGLEQRLNILELALIANEPIKASDLERISDIRIWF